MKLSEGVGLRAVRWPSKAVAVGIDGLGRPSYDKFTASKGRYYVSPGPSAALPWDGDTEKHEGPTGRP